ncbi:MAG: urease accessory protein UreE [Pseudomonadota bacterium]
MLTALSYRDHGHAEPADQVELTYDARFLRRKTVIMASGARLLVNLPQTTSLDDGGRLVTAGGAEIEVVAAQEALLCVTTGEGLARLAWHIGNRHTPCQVEGDHLLIQNDPVIRHMLETLGATLKEVQAPFKPEGGAYGHGRTHSHEHGATAHAH